MASPILPTEGAWIGGVTTDGFAVQCRADQDCTFSIDVFVDEAMTNAATGHSVATASVVTGQHWRGTAYVTDLTENLTYYWRVNLDNAGDAATLGTIATNTAGKVKLASSALEPWKCLFIGCVPWGGLDQNSEARDVLQHWGKLILEKADFHIHADDIYYPDIGIQTVGYTDYAPGHFKNPATDADADVGAFRTNFINTYSALPLTATGSIVKTEYQPNVMAQFKSECPGMHMPGDHDRAFDDCSDRAGAAPASDLEARWDAGRDTCHELFMNLNKAHIDVDTDSAGADREFTPYTSEDMYYVLDRAPVRFLMLDARSGRDANGDTDTASKLMLDAEQMLWAKARIDDNQQKYLVVVYGGVQLDGNHGYDNFGNDNGKNFTYNRDELINYIYTNGNAGRTIFLAGDTHEAGVFKYDKDGNSQPVYEVMAGNSGWPGTNHGWVNGLKGGDSGFGCTMEAMFLGTLNYAKIEHRGGALNVSLHHTIDTLGNGHDVKTSVWRRSFY